MDRIACCVPGTVIGTGHLRTCVMAYTSPDQRPLSMHAGSETGAPAPGGSALRVREEGLNPYTPEVWAAQVRDVPAATI
jgi:hypothetical protein